MKVCKHCGREVKVSPYGIWVHVASATMYCRSTKAEPEAEITAWGQSSTAAHTETPRS